MKWAASNVFSLVLIFKSFSAENWSFHFPILLRWTRSPEKFHALSRFSREHPSSIIFYSKKKRKSDEISSIRKGGWERPSQTTWSHYGASLKYSVSEYGARGVIYHQNWYSSHIKLFVGYPSVLFFFMLAGFEEGWGRGAGGRGSVGVGAWASGWNLSRGLKNFPEPFSLGWTQRRDVKRSFGCLSISSLRPCSSAREKKTARFEFRRLTTTRKTCNRRP